MLIEQLAPRPSQQDWPSHGLVSLWDMLNTVNISKYLSLGQELGQLESLLALRQPTHDDVGRPMDDNMRKSAMGLLVSMLLDARDLGMTASASVLSFAANNIPTTLRELQLIIQVVKTDLNKLTVMQLSADKAPFYNNDKAISDKAKLAFPSSWQEIRIASNCFALGLPTASVFHSMRAAELGLRALGTSLGVTFPFDISLAEWQNLIEQAESKIAALNKLPKGTNKDEELKFYSEAASQFRYFKDGWRVRVAHARASYDDGQAKIVLDHVCPFFETLAERLKE